MTDFTKKILKVVLFGVCAASAQCHEGTLSLVISAPQSVLRAGKEVRIEVTLTNLSNSKVLVQERNPATDYEIEIRNEGGAAVPKIDFGHKTAEPVAIPMNSRNLQIYLLPNESTKEGIALSDFYDLSQPGKYKVRVSRLTSGNPKETGVVARSNTISITIVP